MDILTYLASCFCPKKKYWVGPHDVKVSENTPCIKNIDGHSPLYKGQQIPKPPPPGSMSKAEYREIYTQKVGNEYYWREEPKFWKGPHGVLVPMGISSVVGIDGKSIVHRNGRFGGIICGNPMPKSEWLKKYARWEWDFRYYYKSH